MSAEAPPRPEGLTYGLDDVPKPFPKALMLGLQHVLTAFGATVAVPLILGPAMGFDAGQIAILISSVFICSAIATTVQVMVGSRLPIVQGVSFAFLGPFFAIIAAHPGEDAMRYIAGAIIAGAVVEIIVGFGGVIGFLRRFITPITIAPVIAMIGLSLYGPAAGNSAGNWWLALLTVGLVFVFSLILAPKVRLFSLFPILMAVVGAYLVALVLSVTGVFADDAAGYVSFVGMDTVAWFRGFEVGGGGLLFPWGTPLFDLGFFFAVLAAYIASMIESFGDYHAISRIATGHDPSTKQINRGIGAEGIGCFFTGLFGGFSSTSYSENIGLIGLTKVASRYVVLLGAAALVVLGLIGKIGAIIASIPVPIVGGVYLALFGLIAAVGLSNLKRADMDSQRNLMIVGFVLFMGLVVPSYFAGLDGDWNLWGIDWLSDIVRSVGSSGISVAALLGLFLDNVIPGTDEERGIGAYDVVLPPEDMHG
ncbi:MAG TPA: solute carrier family 23 protein [Egicoccus sp.]|nr:solute carrier family 23 protein [Egicoccus sp.]HSK23610.1 solute carrier family 23 protein [Egicoccus sp.]